MNPDFGDPSSVLQRHSEAVIVVSSSNVFHIPVSVNLKRLWYTNLSSNETKILLKYVQFFVFRPIPAELIIIPSSSCTLASASKC